MRINLKIEKIGDNQIKCLLNRNDISSRNINFDEFVYGTEEANKLFNEILEYARDNFDFFPENAPLVIEAIPLKGNALSIIITKTEEPEELDTRFSKFTPTPEDVENAVNDSIALTSDRLRKANEALSLLSSFTDELIFQAMRNSVNNSNENAPENSLTKEDVKKISDKNDISLAFVFENIDKLIALCKVIAPKYHDKSFVYRKNSEFYLLINSKGHTPEEFNQICNTICEYGAHTTIKKNTKAYFSEHFETILENDAISKLSKL